MNSSGYLRFAIENRRFLAFGLLISFASSPGQTIFIGVFGPELRAEFGLSHGDWSSIYMAGTLQGDALVQVFLGVSECGEPTS